jgi:hypothetical protein
VLPVVPRGNEDVDEVKSGEGISGAWSARPIVSRSEAERRLEWSRWLELRVMVTGVEYL